jgi:hypothetical protein
MDGTPALEEMGEDELLAFAESCAEAARVAEVNLLRVAHQWAIAHHPDRLDPATTSQRSWGFSTLLTSTPILSIRCSGLPNRSVQKLPAAWSSGVAQVEIVM